MKNKIELYDERVNAEEHPQDMEIKRLQAELEVARKIITEQAEEIAQLREQLALSQSKPQSPEEIKTKTPASVRKTLSASTSTGKKPSPEQEENLDSPLSLNRLVPRQLDFKASPLPVSEVIEEDKASVSKREPEAKHKTKGNMEFLRPLIIEEPIPVALDLEQKNSFLTQLKQLFNKSPQEKIIYSENQPDLQSRQYIFQLNQQFWPILPMGYRWRISNQKDLPIVENYKDFPDDQKIEFIVYGPSDRKVNYLTLFNGVTVQSYANTRQPTYKGDRNANLAIVPEDGRHLQAGHCIDHAETMDEKIDNIEYLSTNDPFNIIPEPATWNVNFRKNLVQYDIRPYDGAYMQRIYYNDYHLYQFYNEDKASRHSIGKEEKVNIPSGVYFAAIDALRQNFRWILDVNWQYPFGKITAEKKKKSKNHSQYQEAISHLKIPEHAYMPVAVIYNAEMNASSIDEKMPIFQNNIKNLQILPTEEQIGDKVYRLHAQQRQKRALFEELYQAAETELIPFYQFNLALMCVQLGDLRNAILYLNRATSYLQLLEDNFEFHTRAVPLISPRTFNFFKQISRLHPPLDPKDRNQEIWKSHVMGS